MANIKKFDRFVLEHNISEKQWFGTKTLEDQFDEPFTAYKNFMKTAKKGDTFYTNPDGVEVYTCDKSDVDKKEIKVNIVTIGHNVANPGKGSLATVVDRHDADLLDSDFDEPTMCVFYTTEDQEDSSIVYILPEF